MNSNLQIVKFLGFLINLSVLIMQARCGLYLALPFTQRNVSLVDLQQNVRDNRLTPEEHVAVACPALSTEESDFNNDVSFGKNSLFVRNIFGPFRSLYNMADIECEFSYEISVSYHRASGVFAFGYEVYFDSIQWSGFETSNYTEFDSVSTAFSKTRNLAYNVRKSKKAELKFTNDRPADFIWLWMFRMIFNTDNNRPSQVTYTPSPHRDTGIICQDFSLGYEIYKERSIDVNSSYENQIDAFKNVKIPTSEPEDEYKEVACESETECLIKWSLIPSDEFRFQGPKHISCSDSVTVPIWKTVANEMLNALDNALYALQEIINGKLRVISGVHGELVMPSTGFFKSKMIRIGSGSKIMGGGQITVPSIIYKVIKYYEDDNSDSETKAIIILVHNDPYFDEENEVCSKSKCELLGWTKVIHEMIPVAKRRSKYVYCCPRDKATTEKLGMPCDKESEELGLEHFVLHDVSGGTTQQDVNVIDKVKEKLQGIPTSSHDDDDDDDGDDKV
ncbi:uncharacterized protein LOC135840429 [Planococcus citri]|uniref:uncharacterized protein LOC135840429 n=1 Tax=Planococcus citri TaxID=170843 RepID=UPI0031F7E97F